MENIQSFLVTILLSVWVCLSIGLLVAMIQNIRNDRRREERERERDRRDLEYHRARMKSLKQDVGNGGRVRPCRLPFPKDGEHENTQYRY